MEAEGGAPEGHEEHGMSSACAQPGFDLTMPIGLA